MGPIKREDNRWSRVKEGINKKVDDVKEKLSPLIVLRSSDSVAAGNTSLKRRTHTSGPNTDIQVCFPPYLKKSRYIKVAKIKYNRKDIKSKTNLIYNN